jgi:catechol 2,3-dioxygenase-like lactoylglutathione lyase family enzyme
LIKNVQVVSVPVRDQEWAKSFYVDALEFEVRADNPFGEGMRWIEVAPKGSTTSLTLVHWFEGMPPGSLQRASSLPQTTSTQLTRSLLLGESPSISRLR